MQDVSRSKNRNFGFQVFKIRKQNSNFNNFQNKISCLLVDWLDYKSANRIGPEIFLSTNIPYCKLFQLCERIDNGLEELRIALERHTIREGNSELDKVSEEAFNVCNF